MSMKVPNYVDFWAQNGQQIWARIPTSFKHMMPF